MSTRSVAQGNQFKWKKDVTQAVTVESDVSLSGLGATLLQGGQPVAFASRALTSAERRYAQIEKELLSVVFASERFDTYLYGRDINNNNK